MSSSDVRSILQLPHAGPSTAPIKKQTAKRPEGITRELYALIGDNAPTLAETQASLAAVKYRDRPKLKTKKVKWEWTMFTPAAREGESLKLGHWVRTTDGDPTASVEYFGKFNLSGPSIMEYSQYEYDQHLVDPNWTPHETSYLFALLKQYDLRFVVAADRYEYTGPKGEDPIKTRSVEDIKDRYYTICRRLVRTRTATDPQSQQQMIQAFSFDKAREIKRKQYASELFHLTAAEIAEEEALYVEVKRMEQTEKRYRADRDDLMRSVMGLDSGLVSLEQHNGEGVVGVDKNKKRKNREGEENFGSTLTSPAGPLSKKQKDSAAFDAAHHIYRIPPPPVNANTSHLASKHPVHHPIHLLSTTMPHPRPQSAILISDLVTELGVNPTKLVMPTKPNLEMLDRVFGAAAGLVDMKRQVERVEQELRTLRAQREGYIPPVEGSRKSRSESVMSTETSGTNRRSRQP